LAKGGAEIRITLVNDLLPPDHEGGLELSAFEIGLALRERGHDVHFLCSEWRKSYSGDKNEPDYMHRIFKHAEVRARTESKLPRKIESFRAVERKINIAAANYEILRAFLQEDGPFDVALVFGILSIGLATIRAFTDENIPVVWSVGDVAIPVHLSMPTQTRLYGWIFKTVGRKWHDVERTVDFDRMLFVSEFSRQEMLKSGISPKQSAVIPRGVSFTPVDPFSQKKDEPPLLFVACRLAPSRGPHVALEAARLLRERRPDLAWTMKIAGGGEPDYTAQLREEADELRDRVEMLGKLPKPEVIEVMKRTSIFINPTVEVEGFGRTNIEAMACAVALVTTDIPSVHEIVDANECALLFPSGDSYSLSVHLENLLEDHRERRELAVRGVERVKQAYLLGPLVDKIARELEAARAV